MLALICSICSRLCLRELRGLGSSSVIGKRSTVIEVFFGATVGFSICEKPLSGGKSRVCSGPREECGALDFPSEPPSNAAMDVLEYWQPNIDWSRFEQGAIPADAWGFFKRVVQLSHSAQHWSTAVANRRREQVSRPIYPESAYMRRKHVAERRSEITGLETHQHRAAYLAADQLAQMSYLDSVVADEGFSQKLFWAMRFFCPENAYVNGRFDVLAFDAFTSDVDLAGDIREVVSRWEQRLRTSS
jgi:hypothetical protein